MKTDLQPAPHISNPFWESRRRRPTFGAPSRRPNRPYASAVQRRKDKTGGTGRGRGRRPRRLAGMCKAMVPCCLASTDGCVERKRLSKWKDGWLLASVLFFFSKSKLFISAGVHNLMFQAVHLQFPTQKIPHFFIHILLCLTASWFSVSHDVHSNNDTSDVCQR